MRCWLLLAASMLIIIVCSRLGPGSALERSAWDAFENTVQLMSTHEEYDDDDYTIGSAPLLVEHAPQRKPRPSSPAAKGAAQVNTATLRKRVTPLMLKRVAVRYKFRCALCHRPLDATWETDHIIPLSQAHTAADAERLNSIENMQPVHRSCHQLKSSREASDR